MKNKAQQVGRVRAAVLSWLGRPFGLTDVDAWARLGHRNAAGADVNNHSILQLSAVWACARLISETIGTLPLGMHERASGGRRPAPHHHLDFILGTQPNTDSISAVFWEAVVASMLLRGRARCEKMMIGTKLVGLQYLNEDRLNRIRVGAGDYEYRYTEDTGLQRTIPGDRIWTIPGWSLDGKNGVSVIRYGSQVFGSALATDEAASGTFKRGLMPSVWFKYPQKLGEKQREEAREFITSRAAGAVNAGRPIILENGMEAGNLGINPVEAQLLQSRGYSVEEICRWFRVWPGLIGHAANGQTMFGTGVEQMMIWFLMSTINPWVRRIEQSIIKDLLTPAERMRFYPKFNVEGLLRADSASRGAFYAVMVNNGILTRDEVRELEDRAAMGGNAAVLTVQTAMAPLDSLGNNNVDQAARNAMAAWLKDLMAAQPAET